MTEEQIEKETESYGADLCAYCRECEGENPCQHKIDAMHGYKDGLKAGYHEGFKSCAKARLNVTTISDCPIKDEQKIAELEQQIEKMKCCENCRHYFKDSETGCKLPDDACFEMSAWECKE